MSTELKRTYPCRYDGCFAVFKKKAHLLRHTLIHTDEVRSVLLFGLASFVMAAELGSSTKNKQGGRVVEDTLFWTSPWNFEVFNLPLEIPDKTKKLEKLSRNSTKLC